MSARMSSRYSYSRNGHGDSSSSYREKEPEYSGFQLIGDSQFVRFAEQLLRKERKKSNGIAYIGLCVSGQKISDLLERVKDDFYPTSDRCVLMIGTNDILQYTPVRQMKKDLEALVLKLIEQGVNRLIVLTIPPVPRIADSADHWDRLKEYNDHIRTLHNNQDVFVVDAYPKFVKRISSPRNRHSSNSPKYSSSSNSNSRRNSTSSNAGRHTPLFSNIETGPVERLPSPGALRISFSTSGRQVYVTESERERRSSSYESCRSDHSSPASLKRGRQSGSRDSPPPKRRSFHSTYDDDHDDRFGDFSNLDTVSDADKIEYSLFEEYFSKAKGRKDLIHLNYDGLREIQLLISAEITRLRRAM